MELVDTNYLLELKCDLAFRIDYYDVELISYKNDYYVIVTVNKFTEYQDIVVDRQFCEYDIAIHMFWYYVNSTIVNYWSEYGGLDESNFTGLCEV